jgi:hypothetical protein
MLNGWSDKSGSGSGVQNGRPDKSVSGKQEKKLNRIYPVSGDSQEAKTDLSVIRQM